MIQFSPEFLERLNTLDCTPMAVQFEVDGLVYTNTKLPAAVGLDVLPRVVSLLGPALMRVVVAGESVDQTEFLLAVVAVAERAMRDGLVGLMRQLCDKLQCSAVRPVNQPGSIGPAFDQHFAGEYGHLFRVLWFVLVHNFKGFTLGSR
jgi:hypothetical protein